MSMVGSRLHPTPGFLSSGDGSGRVYVPMSPCLNPADPDLGGRAVAHRSTEWPLGTVWQAHR